MDSPTTRWKILLNGNGLAIGAVVAAGVVGAIVALIVALAQDARYVATTSVSLRPRAADVDAAEAADRIGANLAAWVESESFATKLDAGESGNLSPRQISENAHARAVPKEMRVLLEFEDSQPERAASVVNGLARILVEEAAESLRDAPAELALDIQQMDPARAPTGPSQPRPEIAAAIGAVLGLALSTIIAALLGWLRQPYARNGPALKTETGDQN